MVVRAGVGVADAMVNEVQAAQLELIEDFEMFVKIGGTGGA